MSDSAAIAIDLSAVVIAMEVASPTVLVIRTADGMSALPAGAFDPVSHATFEQGLRDWVASQTGFELGYSEQLYTFGDLARSHELFETPAARHISIGYLGLTAARHTPAGMAAQWRSWYDFFPWEDYRQGRPALIDMALAPALERWAAAADSAATREARHQRARLAFALNGARWVDARVLERYELLFEAGLVPEAQRNADSAANEALPVTGLEMMVDHRRILATAMDRLRGKLRYRPVVFELLPERFTLSRLQQTVEAIIGLAVHKQNFRRALERTGLVVATGDVDTATGGRPAERFRFCREQWRQQMAPGVQTPLSHGEY
ncbi:NUDIX hydrolase [Kushneria aurantia]|uniref:NAD regulator n=1 Tax=Kushneria aurantia TaxID=504092 RepID=A0ABV6G068_9GAMM|nr:hypothetical protein [Kushneria aurantia]